MRYEGNIYRPPSEAYSLLVQVTIGCAHNKCTFCSMFKDKRFRIREQYEIFEDLKYAREMYRSIKKIFLCDGDALCLSNRRLIPILDEISRLFPECERVGIYGSSRDILRKSDDELRELKERGLGIVYIGAESGSQKVLDKIKKNVTVEELIKSVNAVESVGIAASVTFISGITGRNDGLWQEHAVETGKVISQMNASYVSFLTLMLEPGAEMYDDYIAGKFVPMTAEEAIGESYLMIKYATPKKTCVFRSNHASNYVPLKGNLPEDRERLLSQLERALQDTDLIKDERFRAL